MPTSLSAPPVGVTGYDDIDALNNNQNAMLEEQKKLQEQIIDAGLQKAQLENDYNLQQTEKQAQEQGKALYQNYKKESNQYGANAEALASQGLANSGYAESSRVRLFNDYQRNVTSLMNNVAEIKAKTNLEMQKAYLDADVTKAQNALDLYKQQMNNMLQIFQMRTEREKLLYNRQYQTYRDAIGDEQWQKNYDRNVLESDRNYEYQKQRDLVQDNQWQQGFDWQKEESNRNFEYQKGRDVITDKRYDEQFDYQKQRDAKSDEQWNQSFNYQKERDNKSDEQWNQQFNYQQQRDNISDSQWQQEYDRQLERDRVSDEQWEKEYQLARKKA